MTKTAKTITYAAGIFTAFWLIIVPYHIRRGGRLLDAGIL